MITYERLRRLCYQGEGRPSIDRPFVINFLGEPYTVATDGHALLLVRGDCAEAQHSAEHQAMVDGALAGIVPEGEPQPVSLDALKRFVGVRGEPDEPCRVCRDTRRVRCAECGGEKLVPCVCDDCGLPHEAQCDECDGSGEVECPACTSNSQPVEPVRVFGVHFDKNVLRPPLRAVSGESATWTRGGVPRASVLRGDGWTLLVMPLKPESFAHRTDIPEFLDFAPAPAGGEG